MIRSQFNDLNGILEVYYEGVIDLDNFIEFGHSIRGNKIYPRKLRMLIDATNASYNLSFDDLNYLGESIKEDIKSYSWVRSAMVHSLPKETALSMVFENNQKIPNYTRKIFATREAALDWLMSVQ